jgi:hypothetical protein
MPRYVVCLVAYSCIRARGRAKGVAQSGSIADLLFQIRTLRKRATAFNRDVLALQYIPSRTTRLEERASGHQGQYLKMCQFDAPKTRKIFQERAC